MTRVETGSRLHFGLFNLGQGPRRFGGVGLIIEDPATTVTVQSAAAWSATGPLADRALAFARLMTTAPQAIRVERAAPEHVGLGTGTQLALAVGKAICPDVDATELATRLGRGQRSAVGTHGFQLGGFIVEGGKETETVSPLVERCAFPEDWRIVLIGPGTDQGLHGGPERRAFEELKRQEASAELDQLVMHILLPALVGRDLQTFGEALHDFNRRVGERFAPVQGGPYARPEWVDFLRRQGVRGVGQSSWGPTLFAVTEADRAEPLRQSLQAHFGLGEHDVWVTKARNRGATLA
jgi:beta-ribofuranosylaminobenzene 5'-phosphate synthase